MKFFVGLHQPSDAKHFARSCVSINRLRSRSKPLACPAVLVDSGAFTELARHGRYTSSVEQYADELHRLHTKGVVEIAAAVAQDYMCEAFMLAKTGLTIADHQRLTIERYDELLERLAALYGGAWPYPIMPVLQGYAPDDYARHLELYGSRLHAGMWVGVGSVCKRNGTPEAVVSVLAAIRRTRPDLVLHGFGVKRTALEHPGVRAMLDTADSLAWSYAARREGRDRNSWREAQAFALAVTDTGNQAAQPWQIPLF